MPRITLGIFACGTSYHAGMVARYWIEPLAGLPEVRAASPAGSRLRVDLERGGAARVREALGPLGAELRPVAPGFEDLFLSRIRREGP